MAASESESRSAQHIIKESNPREWYLQAKARHDAVCPEMLELEQFAHKAIEDSSVRRAIGAHILYCDLCARRVATIVKLDRSFGPKADRGKVRRVGRVFRSWKWMAVAAASILTIALVWNFLGPKDPSPFGEPASVEGHIGGINGKGVPVLTKDPEIRLYRLRSGSILEPTLESVAKAGQPFRLELSLKVPSHLYLFLADAEGKVSLLYPSSGDDSFMKGGVVEVPPKGHGSARTTPGLQRGLVVASPQSLSASVISRISEAAEAAWRRSGDLVAAVRPVAPHADIREIAFDVR